MLRDGAMMPGGQGSSRAFKHSYNFLLGVSCDRQGLTVASHCPKQVANAWVVSRRLFMDHNAAQFVGVEN